jgi:phage terminase large subunit-like protein
MRKDFPVRMGIRAASNPGGTGHAWVKERFVTREAQAAIEQLQPRESSPAGMIFWPTPSRAFVPARVADNPALDIDDYVERMLTHLPAVLRERLLNGDWSVVEDALIRAEWLRYYTFRGDRILVPLNQKGEPLDEIDSIQLRRIATVDTAGTSQQKADERRGKPPSWSVCQVWDYWPQTKFLFLRHVWRERVNWNDLKSRVREVLRAWKPHRVLIENAHHGPPLAAELGRDIQIELVSPVAGHLRNSEGTPGKVERATALLNKLERGEVFLPKHNNQWLSDLEGEWLSWTGLADETADQIDAASYAVNSLLSGGREETMVIDIEWFRKQFSRRRRIV